MNRILLIVVLLLLTGTLSAQTITTKADGNWQDAATWNGSVPDNNSVNGNLSIDHKVVLVGDLHLTSTITVTVNDVLIIYGDVYLDDNKCQILLNSNATLIVYGNFTFSNPNQLVLVDGDLLITGLLTLKNSQSAQNTNLQIDSGRVFATGGISGTSVSGTVYSTLPTDPNDSINILDSQYDISDIYVIPNTISGCEGSTVGVQLQGLNTKNYVAYSIIVKKSGMPDIVLVDMVSGFESLGATWTLDKNYNGGVIQGEIYFYFLGTWWPFKYKESPLIISSAPTTGVIQRVP